MIKRIFIAMTVGIGIISFILYLTEKEETINKEVDLGVSIKYEPFKSNEDYLNIATEKFESWTIENEMKMSFIHPRENEFNFSKADEIVDYAKKNNLNVRGHTLVWGSSVPDWVKEKAVDSDSAKKILKNHIQNVVGHYKGKVDSWDVVNEAWEDDGSYTENIWYKLIGPEYIPLSFKWAREADPNAKLVYNDFNNQIINKKSKQMLKTLVGYKKDNIPIDGIGMQMHLNAEDPTFSPKNIEKQMNNIEKHGFQIEITEMDVNMKKIPDKESNIQSDIYTKVGEECKKSNACGGLTVWGVDDSYSWLSEKDKNATPLLFNYEGEKKDVYERLINILEETD
ncbi:endo-1,4-beta-xylanase [Terribacillus halophilus]|uniref:endo-1,4-beta-xylanase n=1 Tax=Terribacillus halophilus TaxID=361279 RepID=UPI003981E1AC